MNKIMYGIRHKKLEQTLVALTPSRIPCWSKNVLFMFDSKEEAERIKESLTILLNEEDLEIISYKELEPDEIFN